MGERLGSKKGGSDSCLSSLVSLSLSFLVGNITTYINTDQIKARGSGILTTHGASGLG